MIQYSFFSYAIVSAIAMCICWIGYRISFHSVILKPLLSRIVLLSIYALILLLPLFPLAFTSSAEQVPPIVPSATFLGSNDLGSVSVVTSFLLSHSFVRLMSNIYLAGCVAMAIITVANLIRLATITLSARKVIVDGVNVYFHSSKRGSSFSWLWNIYIPERNVFPDTHTESLIVEHEKAHITNKHWVDLLIAQIILVFQWFNPIAWIMQKELKEIHEFEADAKVLASGINVIDYQTMLVANLCGMRHNGFINLLTNKSSLKSRIVMMQRNAEWRQPGLRSAGIATAALLTILLFNIPFFSKAVNALNSSASDEKKISPQLIIAATEITGGKPASDGENIFFNGMKTKAPNNSKTNEISALSVLEVGTVPTDGRIGSKTIEIAAESASLEASLAVSEQTIRYFINGAEVDEETLKHIDPEEIKRIDVFKSPQKEVRILLKDSEKIENITKPTNNVRHEGIKIIGTESVKL